MNPALLNHSMNNRKKGGVKLKDIGEFGLIEKIAKQTKAGPSVIKGIGDDCAVLKYLKNKYLLVTTDMILQDVHFRLSSAAPERIGHKAMAVNISDIAACGGTGKWATISAGLPKNLSMDFVNRLYRGIKNTASKFNVDIVGGDTNVSRKLVISITLIGEVNKKNLTLRSTAKKGDAIFITGGLSLRYKDLNFTPRIKEALFLVNNFKINSMIDISDGLLSDLGHIIRGSKKGALLYESLIPHKGSFTKKLLSQGEQFELLFTADKHNAKKLLAQAKQENFKITAIGEITKDIGKIVFVDKKGRRESLKAAGYRHF